eukprot:1850497-Pleurochrysis_carterae.AAC.1
MTKGLFTACRSRRIGAAADTRDTSSGVQVVVEGGSAPGEGGAKKCAEWEEDERGLVDSSSHSASLRLEPTFIQAG